MTIGYADRVQETTSTLGTGTVDLDGAKTGFGSFVGAGLDTFEVYYTIELAGEFEVGRGVITDAAPDTLSRVTVFKSSNADALVSFSAGVKNVFLVAPAQLHFLGTKVKMTGVQSIADSTDVPLEFDAEVYDFEDLHDNVTNNDRITIKTKGLYIIVSRVQWATNSTGLREIRIDAGGTIVALDRQNAVTGDVTAQSATAFRRMAVGDFAITNVRQTSTGALDAGGSAEWQGSMTVQRIGE